MRMEYNVGENKGSFSSIVKGFMGGAAMMNAIVVMSFIGVLVGKCYYYSKYSHKR